MNAIIFSGTEKNIKDIKFNYEDDLMFTAASEKIVHLWSTETYERIGTYNTTASVVSLLPTYDSKFLLVGDSTGTLSVFETNTGKLLAEAEDDDFRPIVDMSVGVSNYDICLTILGRDKGKNEICFINVLEFIKKCPKSSSMKLNNKIGVSESAEKNIVIEKDDNNRKHKLPKDKFYLKLCKYINNNKDLLCAYNNGLVELMTNEGKVKNSKFIHELGTDIMDMHISNKEELVMTCGKDGKGVLFDPDTFDILNEFFPKNPKRIINSCKISPLFNPDLPENKQYTHCFIGGGQSSANVTFTDSSQGGFDLLIYDFIRGDEIGAITGHFSPITVISMSNNGRFVATGAHEGAVRLHPLEENYIRHFDYYNN